MHFLAEVKGTVKLPHIIYRDQSYLGAALPRPLRDRFRMGQANSAQQLRSFFLFKYILNVRKKYFERKIRINFKSGTNFKFGTQILHLEQILNWNKIQNGIFLNLNGFRSCTNLDPNKFRIFTKL
jgi:hypothetical protein